MSKNTNVDLTSEQRELLLRGVAYDAPPGDNAEVKEELREEDDNEANTEGGEDDPPDEAWAPPEP